MVSLSNHARPIIFIHELPKSTDGVAFQNDAPSSGGNRQILASRGVPAMSQAHDATGAKPLEGIGGWLILMAISQVIGPLQVVPGLVGEYGGLPACRLRCSETRRCASPSPVSSSGRPGVFLLSAPLILRKRNESRTCNII